MRESALPTSLPPRCLTTEQAAAYCGICKDTFKTRVRLGELPPPVRFGRRVVWDRVALDRHFDRLSGLSEEAAPAPGKVAILEAIRRGSA
ncbi:helix-turn-helix domain-containing protein [Roseomonas sp. KE0001]|uniref:helix-turn-helix transcriptional regulator n=1 Tax=Roseomonas sp. KE0001 TaxID=2479201 RepID=UPI0018DF4FFD